MKRRTWDGRIVELRQPPESGPVPALARCCPCGQPAAAICTDGCGAAVCGEHLLHRGSRLAQAGPYQSEREHTAYMRGFWATTGPTCAWCREGAAVAAVRDLPQVEPLPADPVERLAVLIARPHDYRRDSWDAVVRERGGPPGVVRLLAPRLFAAGRVQEFEGRRRGSCLVGVPVGRRVSAEDLFDLVDRSGGAWTVRPARTAGVVQRRRAWSWEPIAADRLERLLPTLVGDAVRIPSRH